MEDSKRTLYTHDGTRPLHSESVRSKADRQREKTRRHAEHYASGPSAFAKACAESLGSKDGAAQQEILTVPKLSEPIAIRWLWYNGGCSRWWAWRPAMARANLDWHFHGKINAIQLNLSNGQIVTIRRK